MNTKTRNTLILIGIVLLIILTKGWWTNKLIIALGGYLNKETKTEIVTEYIEGDIDSSAVFKRYAKTKGIILNPEPIIKYIEVDKGIFKDTIAGTKTYNVGISDAQIKGIFEVTNDFKGNLLTTEFDYELEIPLLTKTDTITITKTITETLNNDRGKIGLGAGYNNLDYTSVLTGYTTKKGWQFLLEYGKSTRDIKEIVNGVPYKFKQDDLWSVKIIKNF